MDHQNLVVEDDSTDVSISLRIITDFLFPGDDDFHLENW